MRLRHGRPRRPHPIGHPAAPFTNDRGSVALPARSKQHARPLDIAGAVEPMSPLNVNVAKRLHAETGLAHRHFRHRTVLPVLSPEPRWNYFAGKPSTCIGAGTAAG